MKDSEQKHKALLEQLRHELKEEKAAVAQAHEEIILMKERIGKDKMAEVQALKEQTAKRGLDHAGEILKWRRRLAALKQQHAEDLRAKEAEARLLRAEDVKKCTNSMRHVQVEEQEALNLSFSP